MPWRSASRSPRRCPGGLGAREALIFGLLAAAESTLIVPVALVRLLPIGIELVLFGVVKLMRV